jgi:hypothetical protein
MTQTGLFICSTQAFGQDEEPNHVTVICSPADLMAE